MGWHFEPLKRYWTLEKLGRGGGIEGQWGRGFGKIDGLESHEQELFNKNRLPVYQLAMAKIEMELHEARDGESTTAVTVAKVEIANAKEALLVLESCTSVDKSARRRAIEGCEHGQAKLEIPSAKVQVANEDLMATFDQRKRHSNNGQASRAAV